MRATMLLSATSNGVGVNVRLVGYGLSVSRYQGIYITFLTGPAGSGKSSALMIAQQFCFEFCLSVGFMWSDKTFLFTAYTGSAASLFGGVTISKAAFINQNSALSLDDINEWKDVRILIIDEILFMSDSVLKRLDTNSNKLEMQLVFLEDS